MRQVQLDPMTLNVRATGHSAISCFCMILFYPPDATFAIDYIYSSDYDINSQ